MTRTEVYVRALQARQAVSTWQGCDLRGQPEEVRMAVHRVRAAAGELVELLRPQLTDAELDEALRRAWPA